MDDDVESRPPLADDPTFIESLGELDRGLGGEPADEWPAEQAQASRAQASRPGQPRAAATRPTTEASPALIDSLSELDRGLGIEGDELAAADQIPEPPPRVRSPRPRATASAARPAPEAPATPPSPVPAGQPSHAGPAPRRPLIDLFPPSPLDDEGAPAAPRQEGPTYETFYGLHEKPFGLSPDPKFLYHSASHDHAVQELHDAIQRHDDLILVIGERGVGKTMLCRSVVEQKDRRTLTSLLSDPSISVGDLLRTVLLDVGVVSSEDLTRGPLTNASHQQLTETLRSFLTSLSGLKASAVVIFDDAHRLSEDVLDYLATLVDLEEVSQVLEIVLVGRPGLLQALRRSGLKPIARATRPVELTPLGGDEIAGYVAHRLAVAGGSPRVEFDDAASQRVFDLSGGVPRSVNVICDRALTIGHEASASVIDARMIESAAEQTHMAPAASGMRRLLATAAACVALALLTLVGAMGAVLVFQHRVSLIVTHWQAIPPAPQSPAARVPAPLTPLSPPS